ncbi:PAS domain S-box protein [Paraflavisolibacter sp. H34]|uniref:PAS domain-containing sensor histidine kinase n=1 Tax=Huijunlia imazamoxiresistens TaxID=3127457 RepID=UPI00301B03C7
MNQEQTPGAFQQLLDGSPDVICSLNTDGTFIQVSKAAYPLWGYDPGELAGNSFYNYIPAEDRRQAFSLLQACTGEAVHPFELAFLHKNGCPVPTAWSARRHGDNGLLYLVARRVSEKKAPARREDASSPAGQTGRQLTELLENLGDGFFALDREFTITYWNRKAEDITGLPRAATLGTSLWHNFPAAVHTQFFHQYTLAFEKGAPVHFEEYSATVDEWFEMSAYPSKDQLLVYFRDITKRKRQEHELKVSNERFEFVSRATSDAIWDWDIEAGQLYFNEAYTHHFGHCCTENAVDSWSGHILEADRQRVVKGVDDAFADPSATHWQETYRFYRTDGSIAYVHARGYIIRNEAGRAIRMVSTMQDITRRKEAETELRKSEKRFRSLVQSGKDIIALLDKQFSILYISPNCGRITGSPAHQLEGLAAGALVHPDDLEKVREAAARIFEQPQVDLPLFRYLTREGDIRWGEATLTNQLEDATINALVLNARDITARKDALDKVHMLSAVVENSPNSVVITDTRGCISWVNEAFSRKTGYSLQQAAGQPSRDLVYPGPICPQTRAYIGQQVQQGASFRCELVHYTPSGEKRWADILGQPIRDEQGRIKQYFSIQTDITERKEYEQALHISEQRFRLLFNESPSPKWVFHAETLRFVEINEAAIGLYGYSREEFENMTLLDIRPEEDKAGFQRQRQGRRKTEGTVNWGLVRHRKKNGEVFQVDLVAHAIELPTGLHYIVAAYDMTEKLQLQQRLLAEKVAAEREMVKAIIATQERERSEIGKELHDNVNQILTTAKLCMENTRYYPEHQERFAGKAVEMVQTAIQEIRALSRRLVCHSLEDVSLTAALKELVEQYEALNRFGLTGHFAFGEQGLDRELKTTLYRIVQEQLNNTLKYAQATEVQLSVVEEGACIKLVIEDNGVGFDPSTCKKGLGLSNIRKRAELFKGKVRLRSASGKGCRLEVVFPVAQPVPGRLHTRQRKHAA